jgi:hypothetical protein
MRAHLHTATIASVLLFALTGCEYLSDCDEEESEGVYQGSIELPRGDSGVNYLPGCCDQGTCCNIEFDVEDGDYEVLRDQVVDAEVFADIDVSFEYEGADGRRYRVVYEVSELETRIE